MSLLPPRAAQHTSKGAEQLMAEQTEQHFWCTKHQRVEQADRCGAAYLMGPYASAEEAASYADTARSREDAWSAEDERWESS